MMFAINLVCLLVSSVALALEAPPQQEIPKVFVRQIKTEELSDFYSYPARVVSKINASVLADTEGLITKVFAPLGAKVKKGQKLLQIKHLDPIYQYAAAYVYAPVTGVVSTIDAREGTQVTKGQQVLSITDPAQIQINVELAAVDLNTITKDVKGEFRIAGKEEPIMVRVVGVSPFVNPNTGTATGELAVLAEKQIEIHPGLVGQVIFKANIHKGILVPEYALYYKDGEAYLRVVTDSTTHNVPVVLGKKQKGNVEIVKGITDGQTIIERTSRFVGDGQKVEIIEEKKKES